MQVSQNVRPPDVGVTGLRPERLLKLATLLQNSPGWTTTALAEKFNVCRRTIFRDLQLLRQADLSLEVDETFGGYRLSPTPSTTQSRFEANELIALVQAIRHAKPLPPKVSRACDRAVAKVFAAANPEVREEATKALKRKKSTPSAATPFQSSTATT